MYNSVSGLRSKFGRLQWLLPVIFGLSVSLSGLGAVHAADEESGAAFRFAVVNMADILKRAPQSAAESRQLEEQFAERERQLAVEQEALGEAEDQFDTTRALLTAAERLERESRLRARQRQLKRDREDLREEVRIAKEKAFDRLQANVDKAIEAVLEQESLDIIFREGDFVAASNRVNVTDKVLKYLLLQFEANRQPPAGSEIVPGRVRDETQINRDVNTVFPEQPGSRDTESQ
ncbi:MAG: OmpH family outer membrane protein [Thiolinea sp.]